jgi:glycosyltransferase involved in cell wall biosynthesis
MIVIVYPEFYGVAGIARYLDSFLANLPERAPQVVLITGEALRDPPEYRGVEIIHLALGRTRLGLLIWSWRARRLLRELHRLRPVTAVSLQIPPLIPGLFVGREFPVVLTAHTTYEGMSGRFEGNRNFSSPWNPLALWIKTRMEQRLIDRADRIITLTEQGRQELALYGRHDRIDVIPNGVDCAQFDEIEGVERDIDVLFAGRIEKRKGSRPLAEVCRRLIEREPRIRIAIVGYGDDEAHVRAALQPWPDNVLFTGRVPFDAMAALYHRSKLYASTSYYEGLPGTCLEAMAAGLPAVVWDLLFYRGLVQDGVTGLLALPNDHDGLADGILRLMGDPSLTRRMGARARSLVRERYDWRRLAGHVIASHAPARQPADTAARQVAA